MAKIEPRDFVFLPPSFFCLSSLAISLFLRLTINVKPLGSIIWPLPHPWRLTTKIWLSKCFIWVHWSTSKPSQEWWTYPSTVFPPFLFKSHCCRATCCCFCYIQIQPLYLSVLLSNVSLCWKFLFGGGLWLIQGREGSTQQVPWFWFCDSDWPLNVPSNPLPHFPAILVSDLFIQE